MLTHRAKTTALYSVEFASNSEEETPFSKASKMHKTLNKNKDNDRKYASNLNYDPSLFVKLESLKMRKRAHFLQ
uniref:Uncharacterized protein n=1 Tax=Romanomermis culicivorax TaxID=13658 RepID=A0A915LAF3_ROMCU